MGMVPMMWIAWIGAVVLMALVSLYAARVGRYEESQLFLADSSSQEKSAQEAIAARLSRIRPVKLSAVTLAGLMTLVVVAYYVHDSFHQLR